MSSTVLTPRTGIAGLVLTAVVVTRARTRTLMRRPVALLRVADYRRHPRSRMRQ
jgi:hypothetical protein